MADVEVSRLASTPPKASPISSRWRELLTPWLWVGAATLIVAIFLLWPVINTIWLSLFSYDSSQFVGLDNYRKIVTNHAMVSTLLNNVLWLVLATAGTVLLGLLIAVLVDRVKIESAAKATIFIPMAISFVGAGVIWKFVYDYAPQGASQIGLLNAFLTRLGFQPVAWLQTANVNNLALIAVYVWIWTGFCMVILSAALKGVPADVIEAARVDGASEIQIFFRVIVPIISPTIAVVATTMVINVLKIFDIIYVMTGGNFNTNVIAHLYYQEEFIYNDFGIGSALAVVLLIAVIPVMYINLRRFRAQEAQR